MEKIPMTIIGYEALQNEIKRLKSIERPAIISAIAEARKHGDLSENAEYHAAKEQQAMNEAKISDLEDKLSKADVIDISKLSGNIIKFGAIVTLVDEDTEKESKYQIVGEFESDITKGLISISSPIARALIGKSIGELIEISPFVITDSNSPTIWYCDSFSVSSSTSFTFAPNFTMLPDNFDISITSALDNLSSRSLIFASFIACSSFAA